MEIDPKFRKALMKDLSDELREWLKADYPDIGSKLFDKAEELKNEKIRLQRMVKEFEETINKLMMSNLQVVRKEVNDFISKDHPGAFSELNTLKCDIQGMVKRFNEREPLIEKKLKKVFESDSLCEDVYRMKDDLKEVKKELEAYTRKLKNLFK